MSKPDFPYTIHVVDTPQETVWKVMRNGETVRTFSSKRKAQTFINDSLALSAAFKPRGK